MIDRLHPFRGCIVGLFLSSVSYFCCFEWLCSSTSLLLLVERGPGRPQRGAEADYGLGVRLHSYNIAQKLEIVV